LPETTQTFASISYNPTGTVYFFLFTAVATTPFFNKEHSVSRATSRLFLAARFYRHGMLAFGLYGIAIYPHITTH
jgi:hypothetical protein